MITIGQKVYSYLTSNFGAFPLQMVIIEGEVVSKDVYDNYTIKYAFDDNRIKELKNEKGEKQVVDERLSTNGKYFSIQDAKGDFDWILTNSNQAVFNVWYTNKENLTARFGMHIYEMYQQLRDRYKELLELNPNVEKISGLE